MDNKLKQRLLICLMLLFSLSTSCTGRSVSSEYSNTKDERTYDNGDYYAEVKYHNPKTGTRSTYTLRAKIKDNKLVTLYFPNGGWLDSTHFIPPDISSGKAKFTSDRNYHYEVSIISNAVRDNEDDDNTCPLCGEYKYSIDEYCEDCQEEQEDDD